MESYVTYQELVKPSRSPPSSVFGPVRTFLYI
nr:tryptophan-rich sensory protein [Patescibacteria group bacterium]